MSFNSKDSIGEARLAKKQLWHVINDKSEKKGGIQNLNLKRFRFKEGYETLEIDVSRLNKLLNKHPIDTIGSIIKNKIGISDGMTLKIKSMRNDKGFYVDMHVCPWYDQRYEIIKNEIMSIYKKVEKEKRRRGLFFR
mgnify:CR=1 FL=1